MISLAGTKNVPRRRAKNKRNKQGGLLALASRLIKASFMLAGVCLAIVVGYFGAYMWKQVQSLPDVAVLERYEPIEAIQIFDRNDHLVCTVEGDEDRRVVPLSQISSQMQQAILAAEDHHFYEHHGINLMSIIRASLVNLQAGHVVEGGSTITQQLVKNLFFEDPRRTIDRKIREAFMAWELERRYSKERILELYLNQVYFGNGAYGIERAAARYFDKAASQLGLAESAYLAGLVKAPSEMSASANRDIAIARQREILDKMVEYGYITESQAEIAKGQKLVFKKGVNPLQKYPYYISYVLQLLRDRFSQSEMRQQGLKVYTNLDPVAQERAEAVLGDSIKRAPKGVSQGALVSVLVQDGSVVALVGGVGNFWKNQWNRATNPHTAGSSFKPFVYLTAFVKGTFTPDSIVEDEPLLVKQRWGLPDYCPKNFDKKYLGKITVRRALALSRNVCSVRIAQKVGMESIIETARLAGITAKLDPNLSLALGSSAISPLDMAGAYATFARGGVAIRPQVLRRIENNKGQVIEVFEPRVDKVFEAEPVAELVSVLQDVVLHGTGVQARLSDRPVAGKTGTADESKDIWFIGFTPDLVTAVWGGNDDNLPIPGTYVTGGTVMAKIWREYNQRYYEGHLTPPGSFIAPVKPLEEEPSESRPAVNANGGNELIPANLPPNSPTLESSGAGQENPVEPRIPTELAPPQAHGELFPEKNIEGHGNGHQTLPLVPAPAPSRMFNGAPTIMMQMPPKAPASIEDNGTGQSGEESIYQSHKGVTNYR